MRTWAALGLGMSVVALWLGCGGSESSTSSSSGGTDGGGDSTTKPDTGGGSDSSSLKDAPFDGFINAPEVDITFGTCPAFDACGGDEKGSWKVTGGCLSDELLDQGRQACGDDLTISNAVIKAKGTVDIDGTTIVRHQQVKLSAKVFVPNSGQCAQGIQLGGCAGLGALGAMQLGFDKMTCADAADGGSAAGCDCTVEKTQVANSTASYTKDASTITTEDGDTFDYCVAGSKLTYTQTNAPGGGQQALPLFVELGK